MTYFKQAIDANGLDNNDHYVAMYNLAVTQYKAKQYADALKTVERLTSETKSDTPEYSALKGTLLANLDRPRRPRPCTSRCLHATRRTRSR